MVVNQDLARFVVTLFPEALGAGQTYRTLTGFTASIIMDYLSHLKKVNEEIVAFVLPALTRAFAPDSNQDAAVSTSALNNHIYLLNSIHSWLAIFVSQHFRNGVPLVRRASLLFSLKWSEANGI